MSENRSDTTNSQTDGLARSIDWKQGLAIALGVPLLILPSLGYLPMYLSAGAIVVWGLSVVQGFCQNAAYAELATTFPKASGLPGFAQHVFRTENYQGRYDKSKLLGGFSAWSYWFAWSGPGNLFHTGGELPSWAFPGSGRSIQRQPTRPDGGGSDHQRLVRGELVQP